MKFQPFRLRTWSRRTRVLAAAGVVAMGTLSATVIEPQAAHADPTVYTLNQNTPESWGPYWNTSSFVGSIDSETDITISCYLTGDTVTGQFGSENVWDMVSGSPDGPVDTGTFVPDAYIYTGSNSPVVPHCAAALGRTLGNVQVPVYSSPSDQGLGVTSVSPNVNVAIKCYTTGTPMTGPYGTENIWDELTANWKGPMWVPDAWLYTGSNSPVVPHCP